MNLFSTSHGRYLSLLDSVLQLLDSLHVMTVCYLKYISKKTVELHLIGTVRLSDIKLHNEELSDLYSLPNIVRVVKSRRMRWAGHVARMGEGRGVHRVLVGKPEGKRPLGRPRRRWGDNSKMDLQEVGGGCGDWMELAQCRDRWRAFVSTVMNLRVPKMR